VDAEVPCLKQLINAYDEYQTSILGVQRVPMEDVHNYGIVEGKQIDERMYKVKNLVEKPDLDKAPSNVAILGRYIINPTIFRYLENASPGKNGEIQLTDSLNELAQKEPMYAYDFVGKRYDVGNKLGFLKATVEFALKRDDLKHEFEEYLKEKFCDK